MSTAKKKASCWDGYKQVGTKAGKAGKTVPNCVPVKKKGK